VRRLVDCHIHTSRCGHASGTVDDVARSAIAQGLWGIAVTEHLALPDEFDPLRVLSMPPGALPEYLADVANARRAHPDLHIVTGLEADYLPGREADLAHALAQARAADEGVSFVLGSVHFIDDWAFDDPHHVEAWDSRDVDQAWRDYFALWEQAARTGLFDVMAHPDLVKKFGYFPSFDLESTYEAAAKSAAETGVLVEVSTAGLRKPVEELYPSQPLLQAFHDAGVQVTVGSDAHEPREVGFMIEAAYEALALAGYTTVQFPDGSGEWTEIAL